MTERMATLCPFCNRVLDIEMFNGTYGCDSGCDYVRFKVECPGCSRSIYETGDFGEIEYGRNAELYPDDSEEAYRERFMQEFAEAVVKINAARAAAGVEGKKP